MGFYLVIDRNKAFSLERGNAGEISRKRQTVKAIWSSYNSDLKGSAIKEVTSRFSMPASGEHCTARHPVFIGLMLARFC